LQRIKRISINESVQIKFQLHAVVRLAKSWRRRSFTSSRTRGWICFLG